MIKINLLGVAPPPTKAAPGPPATKAFQVVTFVGALIVSFAIVGIIYKIWTNQITELDKRLSQEKVRQTELAVVKAQNQKYQQRLKDLETRINTIQALQNSRVGPVELMTALGNVVNRVNDVYLYTATPAGDRLELKGQSGTVDSMANFLADLKNSGSFDDVQLEQFFQDDQQNRLTYKFSVSCSFKSSTGAPSPTAGGAAPSAPNVGGPGGAKPGGLPGAPGMPNPAGAAPTRTL
jgi:Tfp pilus assembly protein PilN